MSDLLFLIVASFIFLSAVLAFIGGLGLLHLKDFYQRLHAPTLASTLGLFFAIVASALYFSVAHNSLIIHVLLIGVLLTLTTPITLLLLARAALARDRARGKQDIPPA